MRSEPDLDVRYAPSSFSGFEDSLEMTFGVRGVIPAIMVLEEPKEEIDINP